MIYVERAIVDAVYTAVKTKYPKADIVSEYVDMPSAFPCVSIIEVDNYTYTKTQDDVLSEHHAKIAYEVNVYSNKTNDKKTEANEVMGIVDTTLQNLKFTRTLKEPIPNKDKTIYRIVARYEAVIGEGKTINGKTVHQMYRK